MDIINKLKVIYGDSVNFVNDYVIRYNANNKDVPINIAEFSNAALYYYEDFDMFQEGVKLPFILFDDIFSPINYINKIDFSGSKFEKSDYGAVVALQNIEGWDSDTLNKWLRSVKTRASYIMGERHSRLRVRVTNGKDDLYTKYIYGCNVENNIICEPDEVNVTLKTICDNIDTRYPNNRDKAITTVNVTRELNKTDYIGFLHVVDAPTSKEVCSLILLWKDKRELFVPAISLSDDPEIRKLHTSYIVGHTEVIRWAVSQGFGKVNFMMYYSFKESLNFDRVVYPGIKYKD